MKKIILISLLGIEMLFGDILLPTFTPLTIVDNKTKLEWQNIYQDAYQNENTKMAWRTAIAYCDILSLDNKDDWRVPNIIELETIIDISKQEPAIKDEFYYIPNSKYYWSASSSGDTTSRAWIVLFGSNGGTYSIPKSNEHYVRCIRDVVTTPTSDNAILKNRKEKKL